jgi:hypothetical protein
MGLKYFWARAGAVYPIDSNVRPTLRSTDFLPPLSRPQGTSVSLVQSGMASIKRPVKDGIHEMARSSPPQIGHQTDFPNGIFEEMRP